MMKQWNRLWVLGVVFCATLWGSVPEGASLRVFYFGNSLTAGSEPDLHQRLAQPTGNQWVVDYNFGAGWKLWQHRVVVEGGVQLDSGDRGSLTLPEKFRGDADRTRANFLGNPWDAIVLQPFMQAIRREPSSEFRDVKFSRPTDVGDLSSAQYLIDEHLIRNPEGRVFIFANWPMMEAGKVPEADDLPDWALEMRRKKGRIRSAEFPDRDGFDYEREWLTEKYIPDLSERPWLANVRTQDFQYKLFEELKLENPDLWRSGRLKMIPVGDIFLEIDRRAVRGLIPGVGSIKEFYTDVQHMRGGLPRYVVAAAFYAVLFDENSLESLDWRVYADPAIYLPDPSHDSGDYFPLNEDTVEAIHQVIRDVVSGHPYTQM